MRPKTCIFIGPCCTERDRQTERKKEKERETARARVRARHHPVARLQACTHARRAIGDHSLARHTPSNPSLSTSHPDARPARVSPRSTHASGVWRPCFRYVSAPFPLLLLLQACNTTFNLNPAALPSDPRRKFEALGSYNFLKKPLPLKIFKDSGMRFNKGPMFNRC